MDFLKFFKIKRVFKKRNFQPNADFYWKIILGVTFFLVLIACGFGAYLFIEINKNFSPIEQGDNTQIKAIGKERIDKVLQYFSDRENKSTQILNSPSPVVDPSL